MPDPYLVKPDRDFIREIIDLGGDSLKQCFQCATCSISCTLSPDRHPFPRKEMIWAQWGLKDKLLGDPDVWLCHRCGDCNVTCPRGAAPSDVLAAVRDYTIRHYSFPRFMGKALGKPAFLPLLLGIPAVLILAVLAGLGTLNPPPSDVEYGHFFAHLPLQIFFGSFVALMIVACLVGVSRFWKDLNSQISRQSSSQSSTAASTSSVRTSIVGAVKDILTHTKFRDCTENKNRYISHLLTFYGFAGLFLTTIAVVISEYVFHYYPLPLFHPLKIFGNVSTLAMLVGVTWIIYERAAKHRDTEVSTYNDWMFIWILYAVIITGIVTEILRFVNIASIAYPVYFVHLVVVFALLIYLPFSRFAHMVYRTVALVHARYSGREETVDSAEQ